jgi:type IV secretion system protein VirB9
MASALIAGLVTEAWGQGTGVRTVTANETALTTLNTQLRFTTLIVLPDGEEIVDQSCGDKDNWVISVPNHNFAYVKPTKEKAITNLNLIGSSGTVYSFLLKEISGTGVQADLRVNVAPDPERTTQAAPKYYTAATVEAVRDELANVKATAFAKQAEIEKAAAEKAAKAPLAMQFPYELALNTPPFLVRGMWTDGTFTYLRTDAQELPAIYEQRDGQPSLIQFEVRDGVYIVPKILSDGYLAIGKSRLPFKVRTK